MFYKTFIILTLLILLTSCSANQKIKNNEVSTTISNSSISTIYSNSLFNYSIEIPQEAYIANKSSTGSQIFFGNIPLMGIGAKDGEFDVLIYGNQSTSSCSPSSIGISSPILEEANNGEYRMWGEVDQKNDGSYPDPNCRVKSVYPHKNPYEQMTAYAFCSQKGEKTILICISQMTDNPELAEEIFSTFRWLP